MTYSDSKDIKPCEGKHQIVLEGIEIIAGYPRAILKLACVDPYACIDPYPCGYADEWDDVGIECLNQDGELDGLGPWPVELFWDPKWEEWDLHLI